VNTAERINTLEGLLARIQKNAAAPRPARAAASWGAPESVPRPVTPVAAAQPTAPPASPVTPVTSLEATQPGLMSPLFAPPAPVPAPPRPISLRAEYAKPVPVASSTSMPPMVKTIPFGRPAAPGPGPDGSVGPRAPLLPAPGGSLLELDDMDDELLASPAAKAPTRVPAPAPSEVQEVSLDDVDVFFEDEAPAAAKALSKEQTEQLARDAEAEEWRRLEEEARRIEAEEARAARELHERIAARKAEEERVAREAAENAEAERLAALKAEEDRLAREAAEKAEAERVAALKAEEDRLAREAVEKAEAERLAALKAEEDRLAREAAEKAEAERVAALKAAEERLAREAAEKVEAERVAALKAEEDRLAREAAEKAAEELAALAARQAAEAPPASARQPRGDQRPLELDMALVDLDDDEEQPPQSGEIESQRQPTALAEDVGFPDEPGALQVRLVAEQAPALSSGALAVVEVRADVTLRRPLQGDASSFLGAVRAGRPTSFGDLLDAALSLGS